MIVTRQQMLDAEAAAFASGASAAALMEEAGRAIATFVRQIHPAPSKCLVFAGKGHNGGDVLVAARHLAEAGWTVESPGIPEDPAPLTAEHWQKLEPHLSTATGEATVILDGLLGIGASGAPRADVAHQIEKINDLRRRTGARVISADVPSGLDADTGVAAGACVRADATVTIGFAKQGLLADEATEFTGRLAVATIGLPVPEGASADTPLVPWDLAPLLPPRNFDAHKGKCGRVAVIAGSRSFPGAARLASAACVHAGAGLVTLVVPETLQPVLSSSAIPEVMVLGVASPCDILGLDFDAVAIGPGLGRAWDRDVLTFLSKAAWPCVVDADALNALATSDRRVLIRPRGERLLTPHPGEMERLIRRRGHTRREWLTEFVEHAQVTLLLKGARTVIGQKGSPVFYNTTGHPGMATGGMGDVLTGVCAALLAQGLNALDSAKLGAWACGRAAEHAIVTGESQESLSASHVIASLGAAFRSLRTPGEF